MSASRTEVGHYEVAEMIGYGGMGSVYRGRDPRFDRPVAIKVVHPHLLHDEGVAQRFRAEAVIQAKLSHPNIVTVLDFVAEGSTAAIVMEYLAGESLEQHIARKGPVSPELAAEICRQLLSALEHAHAAGIVHRDIKPSNVLLTWYGSRVHVKITDFGVAKILGTEKFKTATSAKMGTLAYMSPEHIKSPKYVDHRTDLYSVGIVLYEMLTGEVPFDAESEYDLTEKIIREPLDLTDARLSALGVSWRDVLLKATAKLPDERFQAAADFATALDAVGKGDDGKPPTPPVTNAVMPPVEVREVEKVVTRTSRGTKAALWFFAIGFVAATAAAIGIGVALDDAERRADNFSYRSGELERELESLRQESAGQVAQARQEADRQAEEAVQAAEQAQREHQSLRSRILPVVQKTPLEFLDLEFSGDGVTFTSFKQSTLKRVTSSVSLRNNLYGIADGRSFEIWFQKIGPSGSPIESVSPPEPGFLTKVLLLASSAEETVQDGGWGYGEPGNHSIGKYTVKVYWSEQGSSEKTFLGEKSYDVVP